MGRRGRRPRGRTPQASALWATRPEGGQADRGTGGCDSIRHPYPRSKGPRPKGGVDPKGPGLSAVPTTPAQAGVTPPPYALCHFGADFSTFRVETHFSRGAHDFPMAHSSLFQWAIGGPRGPHTPGIVVALRGRWPTRRGPCVTRGPRIPTALLAPSGRSTRPLCTV